MAKGEDSHPEMANVRRSDGIDVIFDRTSPASSRSRSRSRSSGGSSRSSGSRRHRGRSSHRGRYSSRSSRSSSGRRSSSRTRSRSHPRCYRPSSRCRCDNHRRYGRSRRSPPRRYRAHSRSYSRSPVRRSRSRSRSSSRVSRYRRTESRISQSASRTLRSRSRSGSSAHSVNSTFNDKSEVLEANTTTVEADEKLELTKRLNPVLSEQPESKQVSPQTWVRLDPQEPLSQSSEEDPDDMFSQKVLPTRKTISFSFNTSLVKAAVAARSPAKVTSKVDSYEGRKPYGNWVTVKTSKSRKRTVATSH